MNYRRAKISTHLSEEKSIFEIFDALSQETFPGDLHDGARLGDGGERLGMASVLDTSFGEEAIKGGHAEQGARMANLRNRSLQVGDPVFQGTHSGSRTAA